MIIPHDDKLYRGGEDSADSNDTLLVVADGVGGWALRGINPGLYSATLTSSVLGMHEEDPSKSPYDLIVNGCEYSATQYEGSATVTALKLVENMKIEAANLGDSGYALFHVLPDDTL